MSACDKCFAPGQCCKFLALYGARATDTRPPPSAGTTELRFYRDTLDVEVKAMLLEQRLEMLNPIQLKPSEPYNGRETVLVSFACSWLLPSGRCGGYEDRPPMCRLYEPESDALCVHWRGAEGYGG